MAQFNIEEEATKEKLLQELYTLNDEYNKFVKYMDRKLDCVISKMEGLHECEDICRDTLG